MSKDNVFVPFDLQTISKTDAPQIMGNFTTLQNKINGGLGRGNLNFTAPQSISSTYAGDGTANRVITTADPEGNSFTPRYVRIFGNNTLFEAWSDGALDLTHIQQTSVGAISQNNADFQGIVTDGFKLGSAITSIANKAATTYAYVAWR